MRGGKLSPLLPAFAGEAVASVLSRAVRRMEAVMAQRFGQLCDEMIFVFLSELISTFERY
jgi:hypothetical protein